MNERFGSFICLRIDKKKVEKGKGFENGEVF